MNELIDPCTWLDVLTSPLMPTKTSNLDLTKKEDLDTLIESIGKVRKQSTTFDDIFGENSFTKSINKSINETLDSIESAALDIYNNAQTEKCKGSCPSTRKVIDKTEVSPNEPPHPSDKVAEEMKKQISKLTKEYVDTMIRPYAKSNNLTEEVINNAYDGLFEFACWIYSR